MRNRKTWLSISIPALGIPLIALSGVSVADNSISPGVGSILAISATISAPPIGVVKSNGYTELRSDERIRTTVKGLILHNGEWVITGPSTVTRVDLGKKGSLIICPKSEVRIEKDNNAFSLYLEYGQLRYLFDRNTQFDFKIHGKAHVSSQSYNQNDTAGFYAADIGTMSDDDSFLINLLGELGLKADGEREAIKPAHAVHLGAAQKGAADSSWTILNDYTIPEAKFKSREDVLVSDRFLCKSEERFRDIQKQAEAEQVPSKPADETKKDIPVEEPAPTEPTPTEPTPTEPAPTEGTPKQPGSVFDPTPDPDASFIEPPVINPWVPPNFNDNKELASPN